MRKVNPDKPFRPKIHYIVYGSIMAAFIVWLVVGSQFITNESSGAACFFGLSLPFLGAFATLALMLRVVWKHYRIKRSQKSSEANAKEKK